MVCIRVPTSYYGTVYVAFDTYTGQRLALLGKEFWGGDAIVFRVGHEAAEVRFVSRDPEVPPQPQFIGRWIEGQEKPPKETEESGRITYI
jgi:hypothetical protein